MPSRSCRSVRSFALHVAALSLTLLLAVPALSWQIVLESEHAGQSRANAVALDAQENVIAAGTLDGYGEWLVVKVSPDGDELWRAPGDEVAGDHPPAAMDIDAAGDVVVAGGGRITGCTTSCLTVRKFAGGDGHEIWRFSLPSDGYYGEASDVAVDAQGDVVVAGQVVWLATAEDFTVAKVSGSDGHLLWERHLRGAEAYDYDEATAVAVDAQGDVYATGQLSATPSSLAVVKLSGRDGSVLWETRLDASSTYSSPPSSSSRGRALLLDPAGNPVVGGKIGGRFNVAKLSASSGTLVWRGDLCCPDDRGEAIALALHPDGGVVAAGSAHRERDDPWDETITAAKFDGDSGRVHWRAVIPGPVGVGIAITVAVDPAGGVLLGGTLETGGSAGGDAFVAKLLGCDLPDPVAADACRLNEDPAPSYEVRTLWLRTWDGSAGGGEDRDASNDLAVDSDGRIAVAGVRVDLNRLEPSEFHSRFHLMQLQPDGRGDEYAIARFVSFCSDGMDNDGDGSIDYPLDPGCGAPDDLFEQAGAGADRMRSGRRLLAKDRSDRPDRRKLLLLSKDVLLEPPAGGTLGDPSVGGAVLEVVNPATGEEARFGLAAPLWKALGKPAGSKGYVYRDSRQTEGPCTVVMLKRGRLKAVCRGADVPLSLNEPAQGRLAASLYLASGDRICTDFGGTIRKDTSANGGSGIFLAADAPAPPSCP